MIASDLETGIRRLREMVDEAETVVPFTGAGISTECGIPDFRSPGGIWTKMRPIEFGDFLASREARDESWRRRFAMEDQFGGAKPGRGHRALASLYKAGKTPGISPRTSTISIRSRGFPPPTWSSCTATPPMRPASTAPNATNWPGFASVSPRPAAVRPIARSAAAISRPRLSPSVSRCRRMRCAARRS
jgi:hypothetical protein